jgi:hypothetical protein
MSASSFALSHSLKKEMPAFRRASPPRYDETLLIPVLRLTGLLARLARLLVGLLVLALLLLALLTLPLLLIALLLRLLRIAFLGVVHR